MRSPKTFALIGIFAILGFTVWGSPRTSQNEQRLNYQNPTSNSNVLSTELKEVRFESKSALHGLNKDHFRFSSETWEASDGVPVFLRRDYYDSPKNAEKALREIVKTAFAIFETRPVRNRKGEARGRRVVATFDKEPPRQRVILWTNGEMLYSVESSSFAHALLFEKKLSGL